MPFLSSYTLLILLLLCVFQHIAIGAPLEIKISQGIKSIPQEVSDVDPSSSSSFVETIDALDIRQNALDLGQIIENSSGMKIRRIGGLGSYSQISIRGKTSDQVMVYVDGLPINDASGGIVDLSQTPSSHIARIEIYKDIIPIEFSEASNGGVINIITHRGIKQRSSKLSTGVGSFNTYNMAINHFNYWKKWKFNFSGGYTSSENNFPYNYENGTPNNPFDDQKQNRKNNQLKQYNFVTKAKHELNSTQSIQYQFELFNKNKNLPSHSNNPNNQASLDDKNRSIYINFQDTEATNLRLQWNVALKANVKNTVFDDEKSQISFMKQLIHQETKSISTKGYVKYQTDYFKLTNNNSFRYELLSRKDQVQADQSRKNRRMTISSALEASVYLLKNRNLILSPAIRFFFSQDSFQGDTVTESETEGRIKKNYYTTSPQIGLLYNIKNNTRLKFNVGRYYRLPNYVELFGTRGYIGSNETLKPEQGTNFDAGFEHLRHPESEIFTKFNWNLSLYHSIIENEIEYSFDARGIGKPDNNNKSVISGIENNFNLALYDAIEVISNTNVLLPLNKSDPNNTKLLIGRSFFTQNTQLIYRYNAFTFLFEHSWSSFYYFDTAQQLKNPKKSIVNMSISFKAKNSQYELSVSNLFNKPFKDFRTQISPGISGYASAEFTFN